MSNFLALFLNTLRLQIIQVLLSHREDKGSVNPTVGRAMTSRQWPNLSEIFSEGVSLHLFELELFVNGLKQPFRLYRTNVCPSVKRYMGGGLRRAAY